MQVTERSCFQLQRVGREQTKIMQIDHAFDQPKHLLDAALQLQFAPNGRFYPGLRALAPEFYRQWLVRNFVEQYLPQFIAAPARASLALCHFSVVTTPPEQLAPEQCVPHVDGCHPLKFALVHYLFLRPHGGTAFYRHNASGLERVNEAQHQDFFALRQQELATHSRPQDYIRTDTREYTHIGEIKGAFNRLAIYPQNLLHSGVINSPFVPPTNLADARLSINSFINVELI